MGQVKICKIIFTFQILLMPNHFASAETLDSCSPVFGVASESSDSGHSFVSGSERKRDFRTHLKEINQQESLGRLTSEATQNISGGALYIGDIHYRPDTPTARQGLDELIEALPSFSSARHIVVGGDILDSQYFRGTGKSAEDIAQQIITVLDRIHVASKIAKRNIIVGLGNHDGPTIKERVDGRDSLERVIPSDVQTIYRKKLLAAGYTIGATSPEQTFGMDNVAFSHIPNQYGPNFNSSLTYRRRDRPEESYTPDLPNGPRVLNPKYIYQVSFDAHNARFVTGPHRETNGTGPEGSFTAISVPPIGGVVSDSLGNFAGAILMGRNNIPYGFKLQPRSGNTPASLIPNPVPTISTNERPTGLNEARGIVVIRPEAPESSP